MQKPSNAPGTRDFGPAVMRKRDFILSTITTIYKKFGFESLETPALENLDTLEGKYGEEGSKLIYKIRSNSSISSEISDDQAVKLNELVPNKWIAGASKLGLRYDLTVPFARFVVQHRNDLTFPFRRYQVQNVWRADRPAKGRFREFTQCDADCIGSTSLLHEADLIQIYNEVFVSLGLSNAVLKVNHRKFLEALVENKPKTTKSAGTGGTTKSKKPSVQLKDVQNKTRDENSDICFIVEFCKAEDLDALIKTNTLEKTLRLSRSFTTNNMYLFSDNLMLTKYKSATDILLDFYDLRIEFYEKRRLYLIKQLQNELTLLNSKIRFINEYINGTLDINRKSRDYIISLLEERDYPKLSSDLKEDIDQEDGTGGTKSFDYLVRMPLISLSLEKIQELEKHRDTKQNELNTLQKKTERDLWRDDLQNILKTIQK